MKTLADFIDKKNEKALSGTLPYIEIGDVDVLTKQYIYKDKGSVSGAIVVEKNDILISRVRPTRGAITIVIDKKASASNAFVKIRAKKGIHYKYLFYLLNRENFFVYLGTKEKGVTYPSCSVDDVYNYKVNVPSFDEQLKIINDLDCINKAINNRKSQMGDLNLLIDSKISNLYVNNVERLIPLKKLVIKNKKSNLNIDKNKVWLLNLDMIESGTGRVIEKRYIEPNNLPTSINSFKKGDILYSKLRPYLNKVVIADEDGVGTSELIRIKIDNKKCDLHYVYYSLLNERFLKYINEKTVGAKMPRVIMERFWDYELPYPKTTEQEEFGDYIANIIKQKILLEHDIKDLESLLKTKIHEYFD